MDSMETRIEAVVDSILQDYAGGREIDKIDLLRHPDKDVVIDIIGKLRRIVFPGFSRDKNYRIYNAKHNLSMLIEDVMFNLSRQIALVLQCCSGMEQVEAEQQGQQLCMDFFKEIPTVRAIVQTDLQASYDGDPAATSCDEIIFSYPGLFAITVYRLANVLYRLGVPVIPRMMTEHAHSVTGIDIHPGATIGQYFFIDHGTGIVIGETTTIGNRVKIYQGVTLGAKSFELDADGNPVKGIKRHPDIGNDCVIYANATILGGNTKIGDGATIGANVWITSSVAPGTTVYYTPNK